jgi:hypothetical protein
MTPRFKTHPLTKSGSLNIKFNEIQSKLNLEGKEDTVIEFEIPGIDAVLIMRLNPMEPIPEAVQRIIDDSSSLHDSSEEEIDESPAENAEEVETPAALPSSDD